MSRRIRTAVFAVILALTFALTAISVPALLAAEKLSLNASVSVKYTPVKQLADEINNGDTGLKCDANADGTLTMTETTIEAFGNTTKPENIETQHKTLIEQGILRYAIYSGSLCSQATGSSQLLVILDFTNYNISVFKEGFLTGLTYALLGSNEASIPFMGDRGRIHTVKNVKEAEGDEVALTVYDSANLGNVITDKKYTLTLQGIYNANSRYRNSTVSIDGGTPQEITHYSIRIVLPGNQKVPVVLEAGSLTIKGANVVGINIGEPKQPDCIGLGISHLGIAPDNHDEVIRIQDGAADCEHFHWMTVTEAQMEFSFYRTLDNIQNTTLSENYADEIFKKPHTNSDFAHLYISSKKDASGARINILDTPVGELTESASDLAAAVRLLYWYYSYKADKNIENLDLKFYHYRRSANNQIENDPGELTYDSQASIQIGGEPCYAVHCSHATGTSGVVGYFSTSGKLYDSNKNPAQAE